MNEGDPLIRTPRPYEENNHPALELIRPSTHTEFVPQPGLPEGVLTYVGNHGNLLWASKLSFSGHSSSLVDV